MLFETVFKDTPVAIVLSKITGVSRFDCPGTNGVMCRIFVENDPDGYASSEPYSVVCDRLRELLKNIETVTCTPAFDNANPCLHCVRGVNNNRPNDSPECMACVRNPKDFYKTKW
jgi:hypothetical protein